MTNKQVHVIKFKEDKHLGETMRHGNGQSNGNGNGQGNNNRRHQRSRNNGRRGGNGGGGGAPNRSQVFDSNGPDVRIRGTAHQIVEKYSALAKDANSSGDFTLAENYLQHAEHYQRMVNVWDEAAQEKQQQQAVEKQKETKSNDDLGLPAGILGDAAPEEKAKETESA